MVFRARLPVENEWFRRTSQTHLVLRADQVQGLLHSNLSRDPGSRDVVAIKIVHNVHDDEHGQQPDVDLPDQLLLHHVEFFGRELLQILRDFTPGQLDLDVVVAGFEELIDRGPAALDVGGGFVPHGRRRVSDGGVLL